MSMPGMNDSDEEMEEMCHWIASLDKDMPLHIIPFRPMYKMKNRPGQTYGRLMELKKIAERHLYRVVV
jgi:pyruvate formate lyase activating enzyme